MIKLERNCPRCHRANSLEVGSIEAAAAAEKLQNARIAKAEEVEKYLAAIPPELMPDVIAYVKGEGVIHTDVCDIGDAKRSCLKRVKDLAEQMGTLEERKPRARKPKADEAQTA